MRVRDVVSGQRARSEDGVSLIEVIVAFTILGIVVTGLVATTINTLNLSRANANRVVAANLAAGEIQRIQSLEFEDILDALVDSGETLSQQRDVDGVPFLINSDARWVSNDGMLGACSAVADESADNILRVDVEVTWEPLRFARPVRSETTIAPPFEEAGTDGGSLAVFVSDVSIPPNPLTDAQVTVRDTAGNVVDSYQNLLVDDSGCLVISGLDPGEYDVEATVPNHVDVLTGEDPAVQRAGVRAGFRTNVEFFMAPVAQLAADVVGRDGGDVPADLPRFAVGPRGISDEVWSLPVDLSPRDVPIGDYGLWAGFCSDADPGTGSRSQVELAVGPPVTGEAQIATVRVEWVEGQAPGPGQPLTLVAEHVGDCSQVPPGIDLDDDDLLRIELGEMPRTEGAGRDIALPWGGPWRITADRITGSASNPTIEVIARAATGDLALEVTDDSIPLVLLAPDSCEVQVPSLVASQAQAFDDAINQPTVTLAVPGSFVSGDVVVVDVASQGSAAGQWLPTDGNSWIRYPSADADQINSTVTFARALTEASSGLSVQLERPESDGQRRRGAVHLHVYRDATPVASLHPTGGVGGGLGTQLNLPGVQLRPGAVLHTTVLLTGENPSAVTLAGGNHSAGPSGFDEDASDGDLLTPRAVFNTFHTAGSTNTTGQVLTWVGADPQVDVRRLRFLGVCR